MTIDQRLEQIAASLGIQIQYATLPPDRDGEYRERYKTIRLRRGMTSRLHRSVLAHELAHAVFGDVPTRFGPVNAKQERRADEWAALQLIRHDEYAAAEQLHEGHAGAVAHELGVVRSIVEAYRRVLERIDDTVYVRPKMGAGQWVDRVAAAS